MAVPQSRLTATRVPSRTRATEVPRLCAISSPRARVLSGLDSARAPTNATPTRAIAGHTRSVSRPAREPSDQKRTWSRVPALRITSPEVTPPSVAAKAVPARTRRSGDDPFRQDREITTARESAAPSIPAPAVARAPVQPNTVMARTTSSEAPAFTPRIPGSARGLRVRDWMSAPATPRAAPTTIPRMVRGRRRLCTTTRSTVSAGVPRPVRLFQTSVEEIPRAPTVILARARATMTTTVATSAGSR